jgi:hypothetical protein
MTKDEIEKRKRGNRKLAVELQKKLKARFEDVIDDPTEKKVRDYKKYEGALLAVWLRETYANLTKGIDEAVQTGRTSAIEQLRAKGFTKSTDIEELYKRIRQAKKSQVKSDIEKVADSIIQNSNRNVEKMIEALVFQKKRLDKGFFNTFKKYGVAYFATKNEARIKLEDYVDMLTQTTLVSAERQAFFVKSEEYGNDLVKVVHTVDEEPCPLCQPFQNKTLSISGKTKGYMTVEEAQGFGLFHPNCYDVMELAPAEPDGVVEITEANDKYNARYYR